MINLESTLQLLVCAVLRLPVCGFCLWALFVHGKGVLEFWVLLVFWVAAHSSFFRLVRVLSRPFLIAAHLVSGILHSWSCRTGVVSNGEYWLVPCCRGVISREWLVINIVLEVAIDLVASRAADSEIYWRKALPCGGDQCSYR
jgi:hypothetical protein